jgi:S1-C subfamily serine protease
VDRERNEAGIAHLVLLVLVVVLGILLASAYWGSTGTQTPTSVPAPNIDVDKVTGTIDPSVVNLTATLATGRGQVAGTGVVLTSSGAVVTNNHVIAGTETISAQVGGAGTRYTAHVVGYDVTDDLAVVQLDGASGLRVAPIGDPASARVGDSIVAIGNAGGVGGTPATAAGTITAFGQRVTATDSFGTERETLTDMIEISAAIEPGDSGGPVVDNASRVIGLTAAAATGGDLLPASAVSGFAIPIDRAVEIARQIRAGESSKSVHVGPRAILGVQVKTVQSTPSVAGVHGAVVGLVENSSPAEAAGLRADAVIVAVDGSDISSLTDLNAALDRRRPGDTIQLGWIDTDGHSRTASVGLLAGPPL